MRLLPFFIISGCCALFLLAKPASVHAKSDADAARQKAMEGQKGKIWASGDDQFVIYLNDKKVMQGDITRLAEPREVKLKPGDVLTIRAVNQGGERGVGLIFVSENGKVVLSTNTGEWYQYRPASVIHWWEVPAAAKQQKLRAVKADNQTLKHDIEGPAAEGCEEIIWSDFSQVTAYLFHVLTVEDLME